MRTILCVFLCLSIVGMIQNSKEVKADDTAPLIVEYLRCEYRVNPQGIDVMEPRLSWVLESKDTTLRGQKQTAYQILVANNRQVLRNDKGNLWDSGKVVSDQTAQIEYEGKALRSGMKCWWKVQVWDEAGRMSEWSAPANWTMGLLTSEDWKAQWIQEQLPMSFENCQWIWYPEGNAQQKVPAGKRYFRRTFEVGKSETADEAHFLVTADDRYTLYVNGLKASQSVSGEDAWNQPQIHSIGTFLQTGVNVLAIEAENAIEGPAGLTGKCVIRFRSNKQKVVPIDSSWKCTNEPESSWWSSDFDDASWKSAQEFASVGQVGTPWMVPGTDYGYVFTPIPYFRKEFEIQKPIRRATVYASALGLYRLCMNGKRIGKDEYTPGWSDYRKRVYYNTYDITKSIQEGANTIGAMLGDGWYAGYLGWGRIRNRYNGEPQFLVQLNIEYEDGSTEIIGTNDTWKFGYGPIQESDFLMGEWHDARKEIDGWDTTEFDDTEWQTAVFAEVPDIELEAYPSEPVRALEKIEPIQISEPKPGVYVYDLGQNMVGWIRLKVKGEAGTEIRLRFAEVLNPDGTLYTVNLREARCIDRYIMSGQGVEVWEPKFTFHGFRYVEITGYLGRPPLDAITGIVAYSDMPRAGDLETSNALVNQLFHNIVWGQLGNYLEIPTDCPQRDERLGWTGDAQVFIRTGSYNFDVASFFTKWLVDLEDSRNEAGAYAHVAPDVGVGFDSPGWADAGIICPYTMYQFYGDKRVLEKHYPAMAKYIAYLEKNSDDLIRPERGFGDWLSLKAETPKDFIATAYFAHVTRLMSEIAHILGKEQDVEEYRDLYQRIKAAFNQKYVTNVVGSNSQTCNVMALAMDLLSQEDSRESTTEFFEEPADLELLKQPVIERAFWELRRDLFVRNWHMSTGFLGVRHLLPVLTKFGRLDIAYRLLLNETFPSWLYEVKNGATTIWERWDGWTEEFGFQNPGMNSFNHYAYGAVGEWLYDTVAGIDTDGPAFKKISIRPQPGGDLTYAKASYNSIHGLIASEWRLEDGLFQLNVRIPVNTSATVYIPTETVDAILETEEPAVKREKVKFLGFEGGFAVFDIQSGYYQFLVK